MNWDRVRQWDRVRDGMSDMELADDRDERWFAREAERESGRDAQRSVRPRPPTNAAVVRSTTANTISKATQSKNLTLGEVAQRVGVQPAEAQAAPHAQNRAATGLGGLGKTERLSTAARRLGITGDELRLLRRALAGNVDALISRERVASLVRTVAGGNVIEDGAPRKGTKMSATRGTIPSSSAPTAASTKRKKKPKSTTAPQPAVKNHAMVYVTMWGNVVHLFRDCHSARGFRGTREPDPNIYRVPVQDPSCRGRRVCGTCRNVTFANAKKVEDQLRRFHGKAFDEAEWQRQGWSRPKPNGQPIGLGQRRSAK